MVGCGRWVGLCAGQRKRVREPCSDSATLRLTSPCSLSALLPGPAITTLARPLVAPAFAATAPPPARYPDRVRLCDFSDLPRKKLFGCHRGVANASPPSPTCPLVPSASDELVTPISIPRLGGGFGNGLYPTSGLHRKFFFFDFRGLFLPPFRFFVPVVEGGHRLFGPAAFQLLFVSENEALSRPAGPWRGWPRKKGGDFVPFFFFFFFVCT